MGNNNKLFIILSHQLNLQDLNQQELLAKLTIMEFQDFKHKPRYIMHHL